MKYLLREYIKILPVPFKLIMRWNLINYLDLAGKKCSFKNIFPPNFDTFRLNSSAYHPNSKQHITDAKMAAGINNLSIANDHDYSRNAARNPALFSPDDIPNMAFSSDELPTCEVELER